MEKKKTKKKWREIRSAVTMMCVMAAMLSSATFAWFTLTNSPTVGGMQMTAASEEGLLVSTDGTNYYNAVALSAESVVRQLKPVTPTADGFKPPVYQGGTVNSLGAAIDVTNAENGYVGVYTFWIKPKSGQPVNVSVIGGANTQTSVTVDNNHVPASSGTFVTEKLPDGQAAMGQTAAYAVRMGLLPSGSGFTNMIVIEPNSDVQFATEGTKAPTVAATRTIDTAFESDVQIHADGDIEGLADGVKTATTTVLEVPAGGVQVALYVWLEGTDFECADEIMADDLLAQIQFTVVETPTP